MAKRKVRKQVNRHIDWVLISLMLVGILAGMVVGYALGYSIVLSNMVAKAGTKTEARATRSPYDPTAPAGYHHVQAPEGKECIAPDGGDDVEDRVCRALQ